MMGLSGYRISGFKKFKNNKSFSLMPYSQTMM